MAPRSTHKTEYALWMKRNGLTHPAAADVLGISERTSKQYAAGVHSTTGQTYEIPEPVRKLMRARDAGVNIDIKLGIVPVVRLEKAG